MSVKALRQRPAWAALEKHQQKIEGRHLRQLFAEDRRRGERLTVEAAGIYLDYSKNRITDETLKLLLQLARELGLRERIDAMFRGEQDQRLGEARRAARRPAGAARRFDPARRPERGARGPCRARQDGGVRRSRPQRRLEGAIPASASAT